MSCPHCYATDRTVAPNISTPDVAEAILRQAVANTWQRVQAVVEGELDFEEFEQANAKLVDWLGEVFAGQNPHFSAETEWNGPGLAQAFQDRYEVEIVEASPGVNFEDAHDVIFHGFAFWLSEVFTLLKTANVMQAGLEGNAKVDAFITMWTNFVTGAPEATVPLN